MMLEPFGKGIMGTMLLYPYEIRSDEAVFEEIPQVTLPAEMLSLAEHISEFEPDKFEDRYENAMIELIRSKQAGQPASKEKAASRPANVVNLMEALRRSVRIARAAGRQLPRRLKRRRLRSAQRKLLEGNGEEGQQRSASHRV
jgi:DNA end-binding protein Ku